MPMINQFWCSKLHPALTYLFVLILSKVKITELPESFLSLSSPPKGIEFLVELVPFLSDRDVCLFFWGMLHLVFTSYRGS